MDKNIQKIQSSSNDTVIFNLRQFDLLVICQNQSLYLIFLLSYRRLEKMYINIRYLFIN